MPHAIRRTRLRNVSEDPVSVYSLKIDKDSIKPNAQEVGFLTAADIWHDYFQLFS